MNFLDGTSIKPESTKPINFFKLVVKKVSFKKLLNLFKKRKIKEEVVKDLL